MIETFKRVFLIAVLLILSENAIQAFPFDESNYSKYLHSRQQVDFDDLRFLSKKFSMSELSMDGIRCLVGSDPITKSEVLVLIDDFDFEAAKGNLNASVTDTAGQRYISDGYTVIITENKNVFGAHLYFSNVATTLCIICFNGAWYGSWVYFTNYGLIS